MAQEKNFENKIKKYLEEQGCWLIKYWAGAAYTKTGVPDLLICCNGYFVAVEVKASKGKPSELQVYNINKINKSSGYAVILYPEQFQEFKYLIECLNVKNDITARATVNKINERCGVNAI